MIVRTPVRGFSEYTVACESATTTSKSAALTVARKVIPANKQAAKVLIPCPLFVESFILFWNTNLRSRSLREIFTFFGNPELTSIFVVTQWFTHSFRGETGSAAYFRWRAINVLMTLGYTANAPSLLMEPKA